VELPSISGITYKWENGSSSPSQSFTINRKAILVTKDTSGCISTDTIDVRFRECSKLDLRLANVFTPNGDGANDEWVVVYEGWDEITVKIINRWGEDVANYSLPNDAHWNGKVEGKFTTLPTGTYFYYMQCKDNESGSVKKITGSINLIR
jgi:gliding motility-associated-like protein